jgi:hypothetical protein
MAEKGGNNYLRCGLSVRTRAKDLSCALLLRRIVALPPLECGGVHVSAHEGAFIAYNGMGRP